MGFRGEVRVGTLMICFVVFILFVTATLDITGQFFSGDPYDSDFNSSYYGFLENSSMEGGSSSEQFEDTVFGMNNDVMESNSSSGGDDPASTIDVKSLSSLTRLTGTYVFFKNVSGDVNMKLGIPSYFLNALLLIIVIIIVLAFISALRGVGKL